MVVGCWALCWLVVSECQRLCAFFCHYCSDSSLHVEGNENIQKVYVSASDVNGLGDGLLGLWFFVDHITRGLVLTCVLPKTQGNISSSTVATGE